jgi:hypothetical protein
MPAMTRINQVVKTHLNCRYRIVMAVLCPTSEQEAKSMLKQAPGVTDIRDYGPKTDGQVVASKASSTVLTYYQPGANLQSP